MLLTHTHISQQKALCTSDLKVQASNELKFLASRLTKRNSCTLHHAWRCCMMQINSTCAKEPSLTEPETVADQQLLVSQALQGVVFQNHAEFLPVFRLAAIARSSAPLDPDMYKDAQPGGYSMEVYAVFKRLYILQHQFSDPDEEPQAATIPNLLNVRAMLSPMQIDTRFSHKVVWSSDGSDTRQTDEGTQKRAGEAFDSGDCSRAGFKLKGGEITLKRSRSGGAPAAQFMRQLVSLRDLWLSFGDGLPGDEAHSIPGSMRTILESNQLPPYRLVMVKDLLSRQNGIQRNTMVGWYVLYAGQSKFVSASRNQPRPQLQGIVVSEKATSDGKRHMCEVLYMNGWVIWHNKESFSKRVSRTAKLLAFEKLSDMLKNTTEYLMSMTDPDAPGKDPILYWLNSMREFEQILTLGERRQDYQDMDQRLGDLKDGMSNVYEGFN